MTAIRVETTVNAQASCTSLLGHSAGLDLQPHGKSNYIMTQRVRDSGLAYKYRILSTPDAREDAARVLGTNLPLMF